MSPPYLTPDHIGMALASLLGGGVLIKLVDRLVAGKVWKRQQEEEIREWMQQVLDEERGRYEKRIELLETRLTAARDRLTEVVAELRAAQAEIAFLRGRMEGK